MLYAAATSKNIAKDAKDLTAFVGAVSQTTEDPDTNRDFGPRKRFEAINMRLMVHALNWLDDHPKQRFIIDSFNMLAAEPYMFDRHAIIIAGSSARGSANEWIRQICTNVSDNDEEDHNHLLYNPLLFPIWLLIAYLLVYEPEKRLKIFRKYYSKLIDNED